MFSLGHGDMAVSNAIGSNVFDIFVCLGLPWFIKTTMVSPGTDVVVHSKGIDDNLIILLMFHYISNWGCL